MISSARCTGRRCHNSATLYELTVISSPSPDVPTAPILVQVNEIDILERFDLNSTVSTIKLELRQSFTEAGQRSCHNVIARDGSTSKVERTVASRSMPNVTVKSQIIKNQTIKVHSRRSIVFKQSIVNIINPRKRVTQQLIETAFCALTEIAQIGYCNLFYCV